MFLKIRDMEKLLTISIAAYNSEEFIEKTLISLTDPRYVDQLEVFIIDDGGTDRTLEVAQKYEKKYPGSFFPIHKENGGYGSTVNYSISHASGKYFKLLDGDDWLDSEGLARVVNKLAVCDEDVFITGRYKGVSEDNYAVELTGYPDDSVMNASTFNSTMVYGMWMIFYKTNIIRKSGLVLPEHSLYTDQLYSVIPFSYCETIHFLNIPVYFYRVGRDGQSTSIQSRRKHYKEMLSVCQLIYEFYEKNDCSPYLLNRIARYYIVALKTLLLFSADPDGKQCFIDYEKQARIKYYKIYLQAGKCGKFGYFLTIMRKTNYFLFPFLNFIPSKFWHK